MLRTLTILALFSVTFSCSSSFNKSILEELTQEEIDALADRYQDFEYDYKGIEYIKNIQLNSYSDSIYFGKITYRQYYNFGLLVYDSAFYNPFIRKFHNEWESKYGYIYNEIDSIILSWIEKKNDFILDNLLTINTNNIDLVKEMDNLTVYLEFTVNSLQDEIDTVSFNVTLSPEEENLESNYITDKSLNLKIIDVPVSTHTCTHEFLIDSTIHWLSENSVLHTEYHLLKINNTPIENYRISDSSFEIPIFMTNVLKNPDDDIAKSFIIDSFISRDILWRSEYVFNKLDTAYRNFDSLCYDFLKYQIDSKPIAYDSTKIDTNRKRYEVIIEPLDED